MTHYDDDGIGNVLSFGRRALGLLAGAAIVLGPLGCVVPDGNGGSVVIHPSSQTEYLRDTPAGRRHDDADHGYWLIPQ